MPANPQWNCSRVADFLADLDALLRKHGLDAEDVKEGLIEHCEDCDVCERAQEAFEQKFYI